MLRSTTIGQLSSSRAAKHSCHGDASIPSRSEWMQCEPARSWSLFLARTRGRLHQRVRMHASVIANAHAHWLKPNKSLRYYDANVYCARGEMDGLILNSPDLCYNLAGSLLQTSSIREILSVPRNTNQGTERERSTRSNVSKDISFSNYRNGPTFFSGIAARAMSSPIRVLSYSLQ